MSWVDATFVADRPVPADSGDTSKPKAAAKLLENLVNTAKKEVLLESAYLIFDDRQLAAMQEATHHGVQLKALTNSMASNDLIANHSGYAARRIDMLEHGIQLFELKPDTPLCELSTKDPSKCAPTIAYGLHAKSIVVDQQLAAIGSFNFNLRSTYLNTESILVINNRHFSERLANTIEQAMNEKNSWHLKLVEGNVHWYSDKEMWDNEPETSLSKRVKSRILQLFPIEKYL
jgi:putative cardiolipin synthase